MISTIRGSIVVSISACHADDPGSIPGRGVFIDFHTGGLVNCRRFFMLLSPSRVAENYRQKPSSFYHHARLAQSVERQPFKLVVVGSSPTEGDLFLK